MVNDSSNTEYSELASLAQRFFAELIDSFIYTAIVSLSMIVLPKPVANIGILLGIFYYLFSDAIKKGQSFGKQVMQISVVDATSNKPCTLIKSFLRNLSLAFLGIIDLVFIFSRTRQRLGDRLANTIVINKRLKLIREPIPLAVIIREFDEIGRLKPCQQRKKNSKGWNYALKRTIQA